VTEPTSKVFLSNGRREFASPVVCLGAALVVALAIPVRPSFAISRISPTPVEVRLDPPHVGTGTVTAGTPAIARGDSSGLTLVWITIDHRSFDGDSVRARRFDLDLQPVTDEFPVGYSRTGHQPNRDVYPASPVGAVLENGNLVFLWEQVLSDPFDSENVAMRRSLPTGDLLGDDEQLVNVTTEDAQWLAGVVAGRGDAWLAWWQNEQFNPPDISVRYRLYHGGDAASDELTTLSAPSLLTTDGAAVHGPNGFALFWSGTSDRSGWHIHGARVEKTGGLGKPRVLTSTPGRHTMPAVAVLGDEKYLVVWRTDSSTRPAGIYARVFDENFEPLTGEKAVWIDPFPHEFRDNLPRVAASGSGDYAAVIWRLGDDRAEWREEDIAGRVLDGNANPITPAFHVSVARRGIRQIEPAVEFVGESRFAVVWASNPDVSSTRQRTIVGRLFDVGLSAPFCGDANGDGIIGAVDALAAIRTAVGIGDCAVCLCDVNGSSQVTATDALAILVGGVHQIVDINCPTCE